MFFQGYSKLFENPLTYDYFANKQNLNVVSELLNDPCRAISSCFVDLLFKIKPNKKIPVSR